MDNPTREQIEEALASQWRWPMASNTWTFEEREAWAMGVFRLALRALDRDEAMRLATAVEDVREMQRNALPSNCTRCNGLGADPPGCPESGPCERCGGWTSHKRLVAGEVAALRTAIPVVEFFADLRADEAYRVGVEDGASFERAGAMGWATDIEANARLGAIVRARFGGYDPMPYGHLALVRESRALELFAELREALREEAEHG